MQFNILLNSDLREVKEVLTSELLNAIIKDKVTQVLDKLYKTKIQGCMIPRKQQYSSFLHVKIND